ncbi:MAG: inorganic diphosphatase [Bacteroidota bacterium]|nr:inorganic diphosphatase [Bacteroidota bacterium]
MNMKDLPIGKQSPRVVNAIVEIPKGSRNKYEYDVELGVFKLDRVLYSSMVYPEAYGFVPSTLWDDGDPLDIFIFIDQPLTTGVLVEVKPIGILRMKDEKGSDDKVLSVAIGDPTYGTMSDIKDVPKHLLIEVEHFFVNYKKLEGKHVESFGWDNVLSALEAVRQGHAQYLKALKKKKK